MTDNGIDLYVCIGYTLTTYYIIGPIFIRSEAIESDMESKRNGKLICNRLVVVTTKGLVCGTITSWLKYRNNEHLVNDRPICFAF